MHSIAIIEATNVASAASGKAGGLVAKWADPQCLAPLSFQLHNELANEHNGEQNWGFRKVHCADVSFKGEAIIETSFYRHGALISSNVSSERESLALLADLDWIEPEIVSTYTQIGDPTDSAQVLPNQFTTALARLAEAQGVKIIMGSVTHWKLNDKGNGYKDVAYETQGSCSPHTILATDIVLAAGPWTKLLFPEAPLKAVRNHSIVLRPSRPASAHILFPDENCEIDPRHLPPEIYPRPDNTIYATGPTDEELPLPQNSGLVKVSEESCRKIQDDIGSVSQPIRHGVILIQQACYRPVVVGRDPKVGPLVGPTGVEGLWLAAGHDCWGIQNGPATGKVMAEMIFEGTARSANVDSLDPRRMLEKQ